MATFHPDLAALPVPRYTSYPTAAQSRDGVGAAEQPETNGAATVAGSRAFHCMQLGIRPQ